MEEHFKIMLVDDHQVIIDGLKVLLPSVINCEIIASALSGEEAVEKIKHLNVDVVIMDLVMPGKYNGIEATREIKSFNSKVKILCLSMMNDPSSLDRMLRAGADGYQIKNATGEELKEAIKMITQNELYIHPTLLKYFIEGVKNGSVNKVLVINEIDLNILQSIAEGLTTQKIAEIVFRSDETVKSRRKQLLKRFSVNNSAELVAYALRNKLIE